MKAIARLAFLAATAAALLLVPASQAAAAPVPGDPCPNGDLRQAQGVAHLPACLALEQVSPSRKDNQPARIRFQDVVFGSVSVGSISPGGDRVRFRSTAALADTTGNLEAFGDWYVAGRDGTRKQWSASHANPPVGMIKGWSGVPLPEAFNADLSHWFQIASTRDQFEAGAGQLFRGGLGGESIPFSSFLTPLSGTPGGPEGNVQFESRGSSADSSHLFFSMRDGSKSITYLPGDPTPAGSGSTANTYIAQLDPLGDPSLELLARDGNGKVWGANCGAQLGGGHSSGIPFAPVRDRGAISADGSRTYFTTRPSQPAGVDCDSSANKLRILRRVETSEGPWISELISSECDRVADPGPPEVLACGKTMTGPTPPAGGNTVPDSDDIYEGASIEGSKVYFTTGRQLVDSDVNGLDDFGLSGCVGFFGIGVGGCDLYLFDSEKPAGQRLTQITAASSGKNAPEVVAISGDGSHAYFTSTEVLTATPGPEGDVAQAGQANLYLHEQSPAHPDGRLAFIATTDPGSAYPAPVLGPDPSEIGVGGDGHLLLFSSNAALTGDDLDGSEADVFRYDADGESLVRISKAASGGSDNEPVDAFVGPSLGTEGGPNAPEFVSRGRWVSEDGETISFKTQEALLANDDNGILDSYIYRDGQLFRLPGTADSTNGLTPGQGLQDGPLVSANGEIVAFQSFEQLLPRDGDTAVDVYAARVEGGFPEPPDPVICPADSNGGCQGPAGGPIGEASGPSASLRGPGNLKPKSQSRRCPKGKRKVRRRGKVRCVKRKGAKRKARQQRRNRHANVDRRAGK